ncbi:hypothetical protein [Flavobacterium phragmitis]|uniref:Uncharacterized protein n=1 Tax=Flavobacterium phragmitis TaxID=739143 RepID=A0A1I1QGD9_9FLAO|nr:hypothetical protein [Flavobacterium phragmitis]SFD21125.1 hypothetical protein SAMN05216297_105286 [Flavobacterium phragmitis]
MKTKTLSQEAETRLIDFFNHIIDPEDMAKTLRLANFSIALGVMNEYEYFQNEIIKLSDCYFWINELAEILNPYLSEE